MTDNNGSHNGHWHDAAGRFQPGNPGKRKGSSKNKLRDQVRDFLNHNWEKMQGWFDSLKPKEKLEVMTSLMPYALARLQSISMTDSDGNDLPEKGIDFSRWSDEDLRALITLQDKYQNDNES